METLKVKEINLGFVNQVWNEGMQKEAAEAASGFIRTYLRENGILRRAMPPVMVGPDEIDRVADTDNPVKILEIQPDSAAYTVPFSGDAPIRRFEGKRAVAEFTQITTDKHQIEKQRLLTYTYPVEQILIDQGVKDMMRKEDEVFIGLVEKTAVDNGLTADLSTLTGGILEKIKAARQAFRAARPTERQVPIQTIVCNENTYDELMSLPQSVLSSAFNEEILRGGPESIEKPFGLNWVVTNKFDLIPDDTIYLLSSPEYIGGFFILQDATTYMEVKGPVLEWYAYEVPAIAVVNDAVFKAKIK